MTQNINVLPASFLKCSGCECFFLTKSDLKKHLNKFGREDHKEGLKKLHSKIDVWSEDAEWDQFTWSKSKYGDGEITLASNDARTARLIEQTGPVKMGTYRYTLSGDKKWIIRKIALE